jgi:hypothetical protein
MFDAKSGHTFKIWLSVPKMVHIRSLMFAGLTLCLHLVVASIIPTRSIATGTILKTRSWKQSNRTGPVLPDDDQFYKPKPGFESAKLGAILKHRAVPNPITLDNKNGLKLKDAWQILYRTQNSAGEPEATVVTVLVPFKAKADKLFSLQFFSVNMDSRFKTGPSAKPVATLGRCMERVKTSHFPK